MFREILRQAYDALRRNKVRSFLTMLGIVWGIVSVTILIAYGSSFRSILVYSFEVFGKGAVVCWPGTTSEQAGGERAGKAGRVEKEGAGWGEGQSPLGKRVDREKGRGEGNKHDQRP